MLLSNALVSVVCGVVSAFMAKNRGKNPYLWFALGALFGIFGLIFLFFESKGIRSPKAKREPHDPNTIDITPTFDPACKEKLWYYLSPQSEQFGPMSFDALLKAFREGKVTPTTYVWNEQLEEWKPLKDFIRT